MDTTPPGEETPKDYVTRRIDLEQPESASENAAEEAEKKSRTRKTQAQPVEFAPAAPAVTIPVEHQALPHPPSPPASDPVLPGSRPKNDKIWVSAIIAICVVALACICSCTIIAAFFLNNAPW